MVVLDTSALLGCLLLSSDLEIRAFYPDAVW